MQGRAVQEPRLHERRTLCRRRLDEHRSVFSQKNGDFDAFNVGAAAEAVVGALLTLIGVMTVFCHRFL